MDDYQYLAWLQLSFVKKISSRVFNKLLSLGVSPEVLLNNPADFDLPPSLVALLKLCKIHPSDENFQKAHEVFQWSKQDGHFIVMPFEEHYPFLLKQISDCPKVLYGKGDVNLLKKPQISVVGGRQANALTLRTTQAWCHELAEQGLVITSGLAFGVDAAAHEGALLGGKTIAVLPCGLKTIAPRAHIGLATRIVDQGGLLLSEFQLKQVAFPASYPKRNRIISGLSQATLIVAAAEKSGSMITARQAIEQNRDLFVMPGSVNDSLFSGSLRLLKEGAILVSDPDDILFEYGMETKSKQAKSEQKGLLKYLSLQPMTLQELLVNSGYTEEDASEELFELELAGTIQQVLGGYITSKL